MTRIILLAPHLKRCQKITSLLLSSLPSQHKHTIVSSQISFSSYPSNEDESIQIPYITGVNDVDLASELNACNAKGEEVLIFLVGGVEMICKELVVKLVKTYIDVLDVSNKDDDFDVVDVEGKTLSPKKENGSKRTQLNAEEIVHCIPVDVRFGSMSEEVKYFTSIMSDPDVDEGEKEKFGPIKAVGFIRSILFPEAVVLVAVDDDDDEEDDVAPLLLSVSVEAEAEAKVETVSVTATKTESTPPIRPQTTYHCNKCRTHLFSQDHTQFHIPAFKQFKLRGSGSNSGTGREQCGNYYLNSECLPAWVKDQIMPEQKYDDEGLKVPWEDWEINSGKLQCPKCSSKLGSHKWSGDPCSCGNWCCPSISFGKGRVDVMKPRLLEAINAVNESERGVLNEAVKAQTAEEEMLAKQLADTSVEARPEFALITQVPEILGLEPKIPGDNTGTFRRKHGPSKPKHDAVDGRKERNSVNLSLDYKGNVAGKNIKLLH